MKGSTKPVYFNYKELMAKKPLATTIAGMHGRRYDPRDG